MALVFELADKDSKLSFTETDNDIVRAQHSGQFVRQRVYQR